MITNVVDSSCDWNSRSLHFSTSQVKEHWSLTKDAGVVSAVSGADWLLWFVTMPLQTVQKETNVYCQRYLSLISLFNVEQK